VRTSSSKIWFAISLILIRVLMGESAMALSMSMPHADDTPAVTQTTSSSNCHEHEHHAHDATTASGTQASDHLAPSAPDEHPCCQSGGCDCPCLIGGLLAFKMESRITALRAEPTLTDRLRVHALRRLDSVFRPPA